MLKRFFSIMLTLCFIVGSISIMNMPVLAFSTKPMLAAGDGRIAALKSDGTVWTWGANGLIVSTDEFAGKKAEQVKDLSGVTAVSVGGFLSDYAIALQSDGTVSTWNKIGNSTPSDSSVNKQVYDLSKVIAVSAGSGNIVALRSDGTVWNCDTSGFLSSIKQVRGLKSVTAISAGDGHTAALGSDGTVWTWGNNSSGQLGDGTNTSGFVPVQVKGLNGVTAVAAGGQHTVALRSDGTVWTWGSNEYGQLGNGTDTSSAVPLQVQGLSGVTAVAAGSYHTVALRSDGTVWTWGRNGAGQLGDGTNTNSSVPVQVQDLSGVTVIAAAAQHTAALRSDGTVWTWGDNSSGQLGDGRTKNSSIPVQVINSDGSVFNVNGGNSSVISKSPTSGGTSETDPSAAVKVDAVNSTPEQVISQTDLENISLLESITLGKDKVKGPSVSILGKTFYLFEFNGKLSLDLGEKTNIQFKVDSDKKTVQALIGFKAIDANAESGQQEWQKMYKETKSLYKSFNSGKPSKTDYDNLRKLNTRLKKQKQKLFANIEGKYAGYLEWAYESGDFSFSEGGIIISAKAGGDFKTRIPNFPASYGTIGLEIGAEGKIAIKDDRDYDSLSISSDMELKPEMNVGVGLGSKSFHIEGGLKGELELKILAVTGYFKQQAVDYEPLTITAEGNLYIEGKAGIFKAGHKWPVYGPEQWYPTSSKRSVMRANAMAIDYGDYSLMSRDYLYSNAIMPFAFDPNTSFNKCGLYPYNSPQLAVLNDGSRFLVWTDDDGTKGDADITSIFYSIYDRNTKGWSEYSKLWDNEGYNGDPVVYCDGDRAYILWQRVAESLPNDVTMEEQLQRTDLYCSVYDGSTISEPELVSSSDRLTYENIYDISGDKGNIAVAWIENSANDLFMTKGTNTLYLRKYIDGVWQTEQKIISTSDSITDVKAVVSQSNTRLMYTVHSAADDTTAIYVNNNGNIEYTDTYATDCDMLQVVGDELYHMVDGELYIYNLADGSDTATGITDLSNFEVIVNGANKAVLTLMSTGFTCEMYGSWYNSTDNKWGNMIQLTDYNKYIRNYDAVLKNDGNILMAVNLVDVNENYSEDNTELYGSAELKVIESSEYNDLVLNGFNYDSERVVAGAELPVEFNVTNNSLNSIDRVIAKLTDSSGNELYNGSIDCNIGAGDSTDLSFACTLPQTMSRQDITLTTTCDYDDSDMTNNTYVSEIGLANVEVTGLTLNATDTSAMVTAKVINSGYETAENVTVDVYNSNANDIKLNTFTVGSLAPGEETTVTYDLPPYYYRLLDDTTLHALYFEASADTAEAGYKTNGDKILFGDLKVNMLKGDVNGDGFFNTADAATVLKYVSGIPVDNINTDEADYNADTFIDLRDVIDILNEYN